MRKALAVIGLGFVIACSLSATPVKACGGGAVLLQDSFQTLAGNWGQASASLSVAGGKLVIKPATNQIYRAFYLGNLYSDADICVDTTVTAGGPKLQYTYAVVDFWAVDTSNFYEMEVSSQGTFNLYRIAAGRWISLVPWTPNAALKKGLNQTNSLEVVTKGTQMTFLANGTQLESLNGQPPQGGGELALGANAGPAHPAAWQFGNFKVSAPN
jgi:hypothetical protein